MSELVLQKLDRDQIELLKTTICKGATDDELKLFIYACNHMALDPFLKQIHAVKRNTKVGEKWVDIMAIQVGIDGYRLIAERTGRYAPGPKPAFTYDTERNLISATAYVKKQTNDGTWHIVEAEAFYCEYVQTVNDRTAGTKKPNHIWASKGHGQLAKCAEALALRKAFPAELSGAYVDEEMEQADNPPAELIDKLITIEQAKELDFLLYDDEEAKNRLLKWAKIESFENVTVSNYATMFAACKRRAAEKAKEEEKLIDVKVEVTQ